MKADPKLTERNIPGMNRNQRFIQAEHAQNAGMALKRLTAYFAREKGMVCGMMAAGIFSVFCGIYAPSLQSRAVDIIAGEAFGRLSAAVVRMLAVYLLYSAGGLLQGLCSAELSQRVVKRIRKDLFGKIMDLPVGYLDTHSHGDVMSRMTNDIENISTTFSQSLASLFSGALTILGTAAVMLWYCWQLAAGSRGIFRGRL